MPGDAAPCPLLTGAVSAFGAGKPQCGRRWANAGDGHGTRVALSDHVIPRRTHRAAHPPRPAWHTVTVLIGLAIVALAGLATRERQRSALAQPAHKVGIPFADAERIISAMRQHLPADLAGKSDAAIAEAWPAWTAARDAEIRRRLLRGDEDSVVHLWLFGTSFTDRPRATAPRLRALGSHRAAALLQGRLEDLVAGMRHPGDNDRLAVARRVLARAGIDVLSPAGRLDAARFLEALRERLTDELGRFERDQTTARDAGSQDGAFDAYLAYYRSRGLSSDTSMLASYSVERGLDQARQQRWIAPGDLRRVAVVGPGLDFVDKADGVDFYPQQTLQPFAIVDSLVRLGLAEPDHVSVTTFDISPRVMDHLTDARRRVREGAPYLIHLPLEPDEPDHAWDPGVVAYWQRFGPGIGREAVPRPVPPGLEGTRVRAVQVRPDLVAAVRTADLNIILERAVVDGERPFDLIIATNILVYYQPFEQALALTNVAAMLRPGGLFLTNTLKEHLPAPSFSSPWPVDVPFDRQGSGDTLFWFRRVDANTPSRVPM